jgi:multidrug efflux pump subunit AcrA (membrane-fusion protein)
MQEDIKIFPPEIVRFSVEKQFAEYNPKTPVLYLMLIGTFVLALILMFIIRVDISVRTTGVIKPLSERNELRSPVNGIIDSIFITENKHVEAGEVMFKIKNQSIDQQSIAMNSQYEEQKAQAEDLENLVKGATTGFKSQVYQQQYMAYRQKLNEYNLKYTTVNKQYQRYYSLYKEKVLAPAEFDKYDFERKAAASELALLKEQQQALWQASLTSLKQQLKNTEANLSVYGEEKSLYTVKAPARGNVQQLKGLQPGTVVSSSQVLGEISPDSGLIAEAYVLPKDIGLLQKNTVVRMQVDAFNYNEWGTLTGKVIDISNDIITGEGQPYFKVRCALDTKSLQLKNGYTGYLKKGMTVQARFKITKRSLYQLLHDKASDWLNPSQVKTTNTIADAR